MLSAEGQGGGLVTSIAPLDGDIGNTRLAQVLDVEQILQDVMPPEKQAIGTAPGVKVSLPPGTIVLAADDSALARSMIEQGLSSMGVPYIMTKPARKPGTVFRPSTRRRKPRERLRTTRSPWS